MKRMSTTKLFLLMLSFHLSYAIPFLHDEKKDIGIVPVLDTQGMLWRDDLSYLTYLCMDELGQMCFRTYPFSSISMPGSYALAGNVSNQITISASNVSLDLNGNTVSGGTNGIVINSGLSNITIKNGTIRSVSSDGIQAGAGCSNITIKDVEIIDAIRGIEFDHVMNGVIKNCDFNYSTTGLLLDTCHNISVKNCTARANTHAGYDLLSSTTCSLIECNALSTGDGNSDFFDTTVFGFVSTNGRGNIFERCIANSTQALTTTDSNSEIAGFAFRGSEGCSKIIDSEAANSQTSSDGFTIPYGILLEGTLDSIQSITGAMGTAGTGDGCAWSPDGQYVALVGQSISADEDFQIFEFDRVAGTVTSLVTPVAGTFQAVDWSPDGQYIAVGKTAGVDRFEIYKFDRVVATLESVAGIFSAGSIRAVVWSPDGNYVAVGGIGLSGGTGDIFQVFRFDKAAGTLISVAGALGTTGQINDIDWSPDGNYIAIGGFDITGGTGDLFQVFRFDKATGTLTSVAGALNTFSVRISIWSFDGQYIAVAGAALPGSPLQVFKFDRSDETLSFIAGALESGCINSGAWSPGGQYIAVAGGLDAVGTGDDFQIIKFDRGAQTLTPVEGAFGADPGQRDDVVAWSPDGEFIVFGHNGNLEQNFVIISGLTFPQNNVITGNTVYCNSGAQFPSGVGISGSSITNMIIGNTAFNNPIPRGANAPIVESNYAFVTNVFNQLFGDAPTALQNISLSSINPILNRFDIPGGLNRLEALAESLIDNLL